MATLVDSEVPTIRASVKGVVHKTLKVNSFRPANVTLPVCRVCHPGMSLQALHLPQMMMAILMPELASENTGTTDDLRDKS